VIEFLPRKIGCFYTRLNEAMHKFSTYRLQFAS
jgi:hypothetical protein